MITAPLHERYSTAEQLKAMQATVPMNRLGAAEECAGTFGCTCACDALSGYVTGQVIEVNGGQYMPVTAASVGSPQSIVDVRWHRRLSAAFRGVAACE